MCIYLYTIYAHIIFKCRSAYIYTCTCMLLHRYLFIFPCTYMYTHVHTYMHIHGHALREPPPNAPWSRMPLLPCRVLCGIPLPPVGWLWGFRDFGSA